MVTLESNSVSDSINNARACFVDDEFDEFGELNYPEVFGGGSSKMLFFIIRIRGFH